MTDLLLLSHVCSGCKSAWPCEAALRGHPCNLPNALLCNGCRGLS